LPAKKKIKKKKVCKIVGASNSFCYVEKFGEGGGV
jgi:hypothetical protein